VRSKPEGSALKRVTKRVVPKPDGRYLIYFEKKKRKK
jgi:hypothetical protein